MTDQNATQAAPNELPPELPAPDSDWFLQSLVRVANQSDIELSITLTVGGTTVTGHLTSGRTYFQQWADELATAMFGNDADAKRDFVAQFDEVIALYPAPIDEGAASDAPGEGGEPVPPRPLPGFIHLRNARFLAGDQMVPTNRPVLWRGRITAVDGFFLGSLSRD